jgi:E-phenylitaconyl-CoA hydratase
MTQTARASMTLAVQGTVRAMWEARDLSPSLSQWHGMSYTHIGNGFEVPTDYRDNKRAPRFR